MIDFKLITFITVAKTNNFTRTAKVLNITQPAVSQHIKQLEEYYNVKLFFKEGKKMKLTEEGQMLYEYSLELERLSSKIREELTNKNSIIKRYNVGATLTIGGYVLPKIIGQYKKVYENREIIMQVENTKSIMNKLFDGEIDLAIVEGPFDKSKVNYNKFKDDELVLAVAPSHPFAKRKNVTMDEVIKSKLILREVGSGTRKVFENKLLYLGYSLNDMSIYMEIGNITALISLVESNLGCTIISKEAIKSSIKHKKLKIIPIKGIKIMREFNFVYLDNFHMDFINDFINFCKQQ